METTLVKEATDEEQTAIENLFEHSYGYRISPELWQWKYANKRGRNLVFIRDNQVVAHYGGMQRVISYFGKSEKAIQIGDVMVAKNERGVLKKKGLYFQITAEFLERFIGYDTEHLLGFGFPTPTALKLACKLDLYDIVDEIIELQYLAVQSRPSIKYGLLELNANNVDSYAGKLNLLWEQIQLEYQNDIIVKRNWEYLKYRYYEHPVNHYRVFIMFSRLTQKTLGLLVFKYQKEQSRWLLLDFIAPQRYLSALFFQAGRIVKRLGKSEFTVWLTKSHVNRIPSNWIKKSKANISIPSNNWHSGPTTSVINGKWWLTAGDTDFL